MKILFVDHECHKKTRSAEFFLDVLRKEHEVCEHYYSKHYRTGLPVPVAGCDVVIAWEFLVSRRKFHLPGNKNIFVPMYDNEWGSYWQWKRIAWSGIGVISFCDKITAHARRCGVTNILDVRYFPDPAQLPRETGERNRVFLWERGEFGKSLAERLFPQSEGYVLEIKSDGEFISRDEHLVRMSKCGIVIAPRRKEGIGMAFLEAMAMGKCVVANNDATMNEYIKNGKSGILFSCGDIKPIREEDVDAVRAQIGDYAVDMRARWIRDAAKINDFLARQPEIHLTFVDRLKIFLAYPLFLLEGALFRFRQKYVRSQMGVLL